MKTRQIGKIGEEKAAQYLRKKGFKIIEKNFSIRFGEIDIIAQKNGILVFVEVKTSLGESKGRPEWQIKKSKVNQVRRMAQYYLTTSDVLYTSLRIDILCIDLNSQYKVKDLRHYQAVGMDFS